MPLPVNVFNGSEEGIRYIWARLKQHRPNMPTGFPSDELSLERWLCAPDAQTFILGDPAAPAGIFVVNGIVPGDNATAHVIMWDREAVPYLDVVNCARAVAVNIMDMHKLHRLNGMTPSIMAPALAFLIHVGFKREGRMREAVDFSGHRYDLIISGLTRADLAAALADPMSLMPLDERTQHIMEEEVQAPSTDEANEPK